MPQRYEAIEAAARPNGLTPGEHSVSPQSFTHLCVRPKVPESRAHTSTSHPSAAPYFSGGVISRSTI
eukprot:7089205-Prymnesium_polylepis.1